MRFLKRSTSWELRGLVPLLPGTAESLPLQSSCSMATASSVMRPRLCPLMLEARVSCGLAAALAASSLAKASALGHMLHLMLSQLLEI